MKAFEIKKTVEIKEGKKWIESMVITDEKEVYDNLAHDMISKKSTAASGSNLLSEFRITTVPKPSKLYMTTMFAQLI